MTSDDRKPWDVRLVQWIQRGSNTAGDPGPGRRTPKQRVLFVVLGGGAGAFVTAMDHDHWWWAFVFVGVGVLGDAISRPLERWRVRLFSRGKAH
jgi:hypothetical protein